MSAHNMDELYEKVGKVEAKTDALDQRVTDLRQDFQGLQARLNAIILSALIGPTAALFLSHVLHF